MAHYLDALETATRDDRVNCHQPVDTADIYRAIGTLELIIHNLSHLISQVTQGILQLPSVNEGLRTDTIAGNLDPDATAASAANSLADARRDIDKSGVHLRKALNSSARLYVETE
jgi:hypothetical protein